MVEPMGHARRENLVQVLLPALQPLRPRGLPNVLGSAAPAEGHCLLIRHVLEVPPEHDAADCPNPWLSFKQKQHKTEHTSAAVLSATLAVGRKRPGARSKVRGVLWAEAAWNRKATQMSDLGCTSSCRWPGSKPFSSPACTACTLCRRCTRGTRSRSRAANLTYFERLASMSSSESGFGSLSVSPTGACEL